MLLLVPMVASAQKGKIKKANKDTDNWRYEIESVSVGLQGSTVVKVWSFSKKTAVAAEQAKKNAIHGVVFKGIPAVERVPGRRPLVESAAVQAENAAFFQSFFADGGDYARFATLTNNGAIGAGDVMKLPNKEYKVGVVVTLNYDELKKYLQEKGVVKRLDSGF